MKTNELHGNMWGYKSTQFIITDVNKNTATLTGNHYPLAGQDIPNLYQYMKDTYAANVEFGAISEFIDSSNLKESGININFLTELLRSYREDFFSSDKSVRLNHSHGQSLHEIFLRNYRPNDLVLVDGVFFPKTESEIIEIIEIAKKYEFGLLPIGGGTNTSKAIMVEKKIGKLFFAINLRHLNNIIEVNEKKLTITVEAGTTGKKLNEHLKKLGYAVGHEPDSLEFSTVGGWIATLSSGMKKNKYGNIEDIVLNFTVIISSGILDKGTSFARESTGIDFKKAFFGCEGNYGIISKAVLKIRRLPQVQKYDSYVFRDFESGLKFLHDLSEYDCYPASVRLMDNNHFKLGQAVTPIQNNKSKWISKSLSRLIFSLNKLDIDRISPCTIVYEGFKKEISNQQMIVHSIAKRYGGLKSGSQNGASGYQMTFAIAYIRDFFLKYNILGESLEATIAWQDVTKLYDHMKSKMEEAAKKEGLCAPVLMYRISQIYRTEALVYFYYVHHIQGDDRIEKFCAIENILRECIIYMGGSLSHHHGVGKSKTYLLKKLYPSFYLNKVCDFKKMIDSQNIFSINNGDVNCVD